MEDVKLSQVKDLHKTLSEFTSDWALKKPVDLEQGANLRKQIIELNHQRYFEMIPIYRELAQDMGAPASPDLDFIKEELSSTDDLFKSYNIEYLEKNDFQGLNAWMTQLFTGTVEFDTTGIDSVSAWIEKLAQNGIHSTFSSGTTGRLSFVPRDDYNWHSFLNNSAAYMQGLFSDLEMNYTNFDCYCLTFKSGNMGVGLAGQRLSKYAKNAYFLYDAAISPDVLRTIRSGPETEEQKKALDAYYSIILSNTDEKLDRFIHLISDSTLKDKRSIKIFGAPFQVKQLCERLLSSHNPIQVMPGSSISFGGGWKTFEDEKIDRDALLEMIRNAFGIDPHYIFEGYSMTEMNVNLMRCPKGRYHLPPLIEPVIYNEGLMPLEGDDVTGIFGYLDPYATSYPGFMISGDLVHLVNEPCDCGRKGPAIVGEVQRAPGKEVKGCGGIMGDMRA